MPLDLQIEDHVALITINNPPLNLFGAALSEELLDIVDSFLGNRDVRVAIITGAGDRAFSAGQDLNDPPSKPGAFRQARLYLQAMEDCAVPIIGAVNGYALGHGIAICSGCDILVASENAQFGTPEIRVGLGNGQRMMREMFPKGHARHAFYTGEYISAEEAYRVGAVFKLVPAEQLMDTAFEIARNIAEKSPLAIRMFKDTVRWTGDLDLQRGYRFEGERSRLARQDPAYQEAQREAQAAFREKRPPRFD